MKYMLMMNTTAGGEYQIMSWPKQDIEAHIAFMMDFHKQLTAAGELVDAQGLAMPSQAKLVRAGKDGKPVTDGVFPSRRSSSRVTGSSTFPVRHAPTRLLLKHHWRRALAVRRCICPLKCAKLASRRKLSDLPEARRKHRAPAARIGAAGTGCGDAPISQPQQLRRCRAGGADRRSHAMA
jgi:hypothetical protein